MSEPSHNPVLSLIVPAYRREGDLAVLLASLKAERHRLDIVVVDDCSPEPHRYVALKARYGHVRFIRQPKNRGPAAARNRGAQEARCELLFFIDSDTAVVPGTIDTILRIYEENPEFVACCGTTDVEPINDTPFAHYKAILESSWVANRRHGITTIGHVGSRAFTIKRSVILDLGGFNENLPTADVEDYEFGYRLREAHGPIPFSTEILVRHRYDTLMTQARLYYRRVIMWFGLRDQSRGADAVGSTSKEATVAVLSTLATLLLIVAVVLPYAVWGAGLFGVLAIALNSCFLSMCLRRRGLIFMLAALGMHTFLSWFICAGAAVAVAKAFFAKFRLSTGGTAASPVMEVGDVN